MLTLPQVARLTSDEDPDVRTNALFALGDLGGSAPSTFSDDGRAPMGGRRPPCAEEAFD